MRNSECGETTTTSSLESYRADISRCVRCGVCRAVCPSFQPDREESLSPRGRIALIHAVLDKRLPLSAIFADRLATCTSCLACETACPSNVPVTAIIQAAKEDAVRASGRGLISRFVAATLTNDRAMRSLAWLAPVVLHYAKGRQGRRGSGWVRITEKSEWARGKDPGFRDKRQDRFLSRMRHQTLPAGHRHRSRCRA